MDSITWEQTGGNRHTVTIFRNDDGYPPEWNRVYEHGKFVRAFPPVTWGDCLFSHCHFIDCFFDPGSDEGRKIIASLDGTPY